jgi:CBS domain-containing protein
MTDKKLIDLMVPVSEYVTVDEDATLFEAVQALVKAQASFEKNRYHHRAVLVLDRQQKNVVCKLAQVDILRALEPKYESIELGRFGYSRKFMATLQDKFRLWEEPLDNICKKAMEKKVSNFITPPIEGELIDENASLSDAIHQLVLGCHQSLLVTSGSEIIGVLRLSDVFHEVSVIMRSCAL